MAKETENSIVTFKTHLESFLKVSTSGSCVNAGPYGNSKDPLAGAGTMPQRSWTTFALKELTVSPVYAYLNLPSCREATLEFFASLIREHLALYLTNLENKGGGQAADYGNIEEALNEIDLAIHQDLRDRDGQSDELRLFEWTLEILAEISKKNANRGAFANTNGELSETLRIYTTCRATRLLLDLLNECVGRLLTIAPERCVAGLLETTARFGAFCDWILTFIGTKYPKTIIEQLLTVGASDFHTFLTEMIAKQSSLNPQQLNSKREQYNREKLVSLSSIIGHLARQQGAEVRRQLAAIITNGLEANPDQRQQYALVFVIKTASLSKELADLLMQDLHYLVTADHIAMIIRAFGTIPREIVFGEHNPAHILINVIMSLRQTTLSFLYDKLLHLAFDELNLEKRDPRTNIVMIQKYALTILEVLMTNTEKQVHSVPKLTIDSTPLLNEIEKNLPLALDRLFSTNELQRTYYFKSLTLLCLVKGEAKTIETLAHVLFHASTNQQLSLFHCFGRILHPIHSGTVEKLFVNLPEYYKKLKASSMAVPMRGFDENEWQWVENMRTLVQWDQKPTTNPAKSEMNTPKKEINTLNLIELIVDNYSSIAQYLLPLVAVKTCRRAALDILIRLGQPRQQTPKTVVRLATLSCSLLFRTFGELDTPDGLEMHKLFVDYLVIFVQSQPPYAVEMVMRSILDKVLRGGAVRPEAIYLFGLSNSGSLDHKERKMDTKFDGDSKMDDGDGNKSKESGAQLLAANQKLRNLKRSAGGGGVDETSSYTPLNLVHSGVIKRRFPQNATAIGGRGERVEPPITKNGILAKLALVRVIDRLCNAPIRPVAPAGRRQTFALPPPIAKTPSSAMATCTYSLDTCRLLASLLTEYFCPDAIAADHTWDDWEATKLSIERLLATSKRMDEIPFAWDLLTIVAEAYPCLWFALPVVKSILGASITQCENAINKRDGLSPKLLNTLERLFLIMYKGKILGKPLAHIVDLLPHLATYETARILGEVWKYLKNIAPSTEDLEQHFESVQCHYGDVSVESLKGDYQAHIKPIRLLIQKHIVETGHLLKKFIELPPREDISSDSARLMCPAFRKP